MGFPWQVVFGGNNPLFCTLTSLALWLEIMIALPYGGATPYVFALNADVRVPEGGERSKEMIQMHLRKNIFAREAFMDSGKLGTHSVRKFASTDCRNKGASRDEKDYRGRWKSRTRVSDTYDDIKLPYIDAKVAGLLCRGGPVKYKVRKNVSNIYFF